MSDGQTTTVEQIVGESKVTLNDALDVATAVRPGFEPNRNVMIVHGRNARARDAMIDFLSSVDLRPLEWEKAVQQTLEGSPDIENVVRQAILGSAAVVVLFTADDEARLKTALRSDIEPAHEVTLTGQPRPNVILETGMALMVAPDKTIIVELERTRPISDIQSRNRLWFDGSPESRNALLHRLRSIGVQADSKGARWLKAGNFEFLRSATPAGGIDGIAIQSTLSNRLASSIAATRRKTSGLTSVKVTSESGHSINNAVIAAVAENGTVVNSMTSVDGQPTLSLIQGKLYTILCAHNDFVGAISNEFEPSAELTLTMNQKAGISSIIFFGGTGQIQGLGGRLNPIEDSTRRTYLYADNIAINGGTQQPVTFALNELIELEDAKGRIVSIAIKFIRGDTALVQYASAPSTS